ncbi:hypothetical protein [Xanthomonas sp. SHU 308]|uniref:hypothetical protein n=1 Tax=Xanthomonas sp. SHU 308 TaxID=1591201 RepID=UPI0012FF57A0|nr:hypothetical protein [Xanthomonas sp. SHU 308]
MNFTCSCLECASERKHGFLYVPFHQQGIYRVTCGNGHRIVFIVQEHPFEVLFHIASNAVIDGYYREAITSFAASLERFYEFTARVLLLARGLDHSLIDASWKAITDKSERQLGAYIALWSAHFMEPPKMLSGSLVQFRNDVVHKGVIPTQDKALDFGQAILELIATQRDKLKASCHAEINAVVMNRNAGLISSVAGEPKVGVATVDSAVGLSSSQSEPLKQVIERMRRDRHDIDMAVKALDGFSRQVDGC